MKYDWDNLVPFCHSRAGGNPLPRSDHMFADIIGELPAAHWIPTFVGMTNELIVCMGDDKSVNINIIMKKSFIMIDKGGNTV